MRVKEPEIIHASDVPYSGGALLQPADVAYRDVCRNCSRLHAWI